MELESFGVAMVNWNRGGATSGIDLHVGLASPESGGLQGYFNLAAPCHPSLIALCVSTLASLPSALSPGEGWPQKFQTSHPLPFHAPQMSGSRHAQIGDEHLS